MDEPEGAAMAPSPASGPEPAAEPAPEPAEAAAPASAPAAAPEAASGKQKPVVRSREQFTEVWQRFMASRGLDSSPQIFNRAPLDLWKLFRHVMKAGGCQAVIESKQWARIGRTFNPPSSMTDLSFQMKRAYTCKLLEFEQASLSGPASWAYKAGQVDAEFLFEGAGTPEPPHKKAAEAAAAEVKPEPQEEGAERAPERRQTRGQSSQQQQQRQAGSGGGQATGVASQEAMPPPQPRPASSARPRTKAAPKPSRSAGSKRAASPSPEAGGEAPSGERRMGSVRPHIRRRSVTASPAGSPPGSPGGSVPASKGGERAAHKPGGAASEAAGPALVPARAHPKRQRTPRLREGAPAVAAAPEDLLGRRIAIWWGDQDTYYHATVVGYDAASEVHAVRYDDGNHEELALGFEEWVLLEPPPPAQAAAGSQQQQQRAPAAGALAGAPSPKRSLGLLGAAAPAGAGHPSPAAARLEELLAEAGLSYLESPLGLGPSSVPPPALDADPLASLAQPAWHQQPLLGLSPQGPPLGAPPSLPLFAPSTALAPGVGTLAAAAAPTSSIEALLPPPPPAGAPLAPSALPHPAPPPQPLVACGPHYRVYAAPLPLAAYDLFFLLPGLSIEEINVRCWSNGEVLVCTAPHGPRAGASALAPPPVSHRVRLPARLDTSSALAMFTPSGQLFLRVSRAPAPAVSSWRL